MIKNILYFLSFFIATLLIVEFYSFTVLENHNKSQPFMYDYKKGPKTLESMQQAWSKIYQVSIITPLLGYSRKVAPNNTKLDAYASLETGSIKIIIL